MMDMNKIKRIKELFFLEKFDLLTESEKAELLEFRDSDPAQAVKLESESTDYFSSIALSGQSAEPSSRLKRQILNNISKKKSVYSQGSDSRVTPLVNYLIANPVAYILGMAVLIVASVIYIQFNQVNEKQAQLVSLMNSNRVYAELAQIIYPDKYMMFDLKTSLDNISAKAKVFLTKDNSTGLFQSETKLPANKKKDYQLWLVKDSKMINGGVLQVSDGDSVLYHPLKNLPIADLEQIDGLVITVEPKGGVDTPSGDQIIVGVQAPKEF
ncbi:MAG: hypothetical protein AMXMBFR48_09330 [Ignavibacteriales bacterium]